MSTRRRSRRGAASVASLSAISTAFVALAIADPGYLSPDVTLHDSGVWVTRSPGDPDTLGRFNYEAQTIDAGLVGGAAGSDVLQHDGTVLLTDPVAGTVSVVDPAAVEAGGAIALPEGARVALGGETVAVWVPAGGSLWVLPVGSLGGFDPEETRATATVGPGTDVAVATDGTAFVADPAGRRLLTVRTTGDTVAEPTVADLAVASDDAVQVTAVGDTPVVLDTDAGTLLVGGRTVAAPSATGVVLQEAGPAAATVALASEEGLVLQPLDGSAPATIPATGEPVRPVRVASCTYGAWSGGDVVRQCGTDAPYTDTLTVTGDLRYRVNRGYVVLNDLAAGTVWLADQEFVQRDAWADLKPAQDPNQQETDDVATQTDQILRERQLPNRPPVAEDDTYGVRAGRTTILPVLDNDTDPDGDVLRATPDGDPSIGTVQAIQYGGALQVAVPADASGTATFTYTLDDGRENGTSSATVTLEVRKDGANGAPTRVRDTVAKVEQTHSVDITALDDWRDPDGDVLQLVGATVASGDDSVRFTPDGRVTFVDAGKELGRKTVDITVSDGQAVTDGQLFVDVVANGQNEPPFAGVDHVATVAGQSVTISPLANDTDPNGDILRLARVDDVAGATIVRNLDAGTVTFTAAAAGVYYLTYLVSDGPSVTVGLIRVDVAAADAAAGAPVAVRDRALLPVDGSVLVDVLANDTDPRGSVLVVQSVDVDPTVGASVAVLGHAVLRISAVRLTGVPFTVHYAVSNGFATSQGEVAVLPIVRAGESQPPQAVPDEVTVRAGDVATIDVLANDSQPDGLPLTIDPTITDPPPAAAGQMFVSEGVVRFQAAPDAGGQTVSGTYTVADPQGHRVGALITVHIKAAEAAGNAAPTPAAVTARALAGETTRIAIPLTGIDPDGDSVVLVGLSGAPKLGRITAVGDGWVDYEAVRDAAGTDSFTYTVADTYGATAQGVVLVGVAAPQRANQPPVAVPDERTARPDRDLLVDVLANDVDPEGDRLGLKGEPTVGDGVTASVQGDRLLVHTGGTPGTYAVRYTVSDGTSSAEGVLTVTVAADAPTVAPVARDDRLALADIVGRDLVKVSVLDNDEDPDGSRADLTAWSDVPDVTGSGGTSLSIPVLAASRVVAYTVRDVDGNASPPAYVWVPGSDAIRPTLTPGLAPLTVDSGAELRVDLRDLVVVAPGRTVRVTQAEKVGWLKGSGQVVDEHTITYTSAATYYGAAAVTVEVIDTPTVDDPTGRTAVLSIPIQVTASPAAPPELAGVERTVALGEPTDVDLTRYATDPTDDPLTFRVKDVPSQLTASLDGSTLRVEPAKGTPVGTKLTLTLLVSDATTEVSGQATFTVVSSDKPLATLVDDEVPDANAGTAYPVKVLANDLAPIPGKDLSIVSAVVESGTGTVVNDATTVTATPDKDFFGTMVVAYTVDDGTGDPARQAVGRLRLTVRKAPDAPGVPTVVEVRSHTAVISWVPPNNNGAPITGYTVRVKGVGGSTVACPTTTCTIGDLTNDQPYTFTVVATNEVGDSPESAASAQIRPDERPDPPAAPTLVFGDGSLTVTWTNKDYAGERSAIQNVNLEISPAPPSGASQKTGLTGLTTVWQGLENGTAYTVRVQAVNKADTPSDWGAWSAAEIPAGVPDAPGQPTTSMLAPVGSQAQMLVSWPAPASTHGDAVKTYTLQVFHGGATAEQTIDVGTATSKAVTLTVSETPFTYQVVATNKAGPSAPSPISAARQAVVAPGAVSGLTSSATGGNGTLQLAFSDAPRNGATASQMRYEYALNGGSWSTLAGNKQIGGLVNGSAYSVQVRAASTVDGATYTGPATASGYSGPNSSGAGVAPYGPLPNVSVGASGGATTVSLSASAAANGCGVTLHYRVDGGGWTTTSSSWSGTVGNGYSQGHSIDAYSTDNCGQTSATQSASASSGPPPVSAWVSRGSRPPAANCSDSTCGYLVLNTENVPAGSHTVKCWNNHGGVWGADATVTVNVPATGSVQTACYYGYRGEQVRLEVVGVITTPDFTWPSTAN